MDYDFLSQSGMELTVKIDNQEVVFENTGEETDSQEYSNSYFMDGYVGDELKYEAVGTFSYGSEEFEDLTQIESI